MTYLLEERETVVERFGEGRHVKPDVEGRDWGDRDRETHVAKALEAVISLDLEREG